MKGELSEIWAVSRSRPTDLIECLQGFVVLGNIKLVSLTRIRAYAGAAQRILVRV